MLCYKNGRFYSEKVSFQIPDGFYFEDDVEMMDEYGFCAWDPEQAYLFCWRFYEDCEGTAKELQNWFLCGCKPLSEIIEVKLNGLIGHCVLYEFNHMQYYESRFELGDRKEFGLLVKSEKKDIGEMIRSPALKMVLKGVQAEN